MHGQTNIKFGPSIILVGGFRNNRTMFRRLDVATSVLMKIQFKYSGIWRRIDWEIITDFSEGIVLSIFRVCAVRTAIKQIEFPDKRVLIKI